MTDPHSLEWIQKAIQQRLVGEPVHAAQDLRDYLLDRPPPGRYPADDMTYAVYLEEVLERKAIPWRASFSWAIFADIRGMGPEIKQVILRGFTVSEIKEKLLRYPDDADLHTAAGRLAAHEKNADLLQAALMPSRHGTAEVIVDDACGGCVFNQDSLDLQTLLGAGIEMNLILEGLLAYRIQEWAPKIDTAIRQLLTEADTRAPDCLPQLCEHLAAHGLPIPAETLVAVVRQDLQTTPSFSAP